jgi:uncharacterized repeat protein (TIGR01451 family)
MRGIGLALLAALLGALPCTLPVLGQGCEPLPVSSAGQLGCSVNLHAGAQQTLALGANLGGDAHTGSVTVCLRGASLKCESPLTPTDGQAGDEFGRSVAIDDDWLAVGAPFAKGSGVIYLYQRDGGNLTLRQELAASDAARGDQFGLTLALSGDTLIVGAPNAVGTGGSLAGVVYVFHLDGGTWRQAQTLTAGDARPFDNFGFSLAIDGSLVVVGAPFHDGAAGNSGAAYVFQGSGSAWSQVARLTASDGVANAEYGSSVAVSGSAVAVGARAAGAGEAYVYEPGGPAGWSEAAHFVGQVAGDRFGVAAAMDGSGTQLVVGALLHGGTGAAYLYERKSAGWVQDGPPLPGAAPGDRFGQAVSADGGEALVGAYLAHGPSAGEVCDFAPPPPVPSADVGITASAPASIEPGRTLTYTLTVTNHGPGPATGVLVEEVIPDGLKPAAGPLHAGCTVGTEAIDCALPDLAAGESLTIPLRFEVLESCLRVIQSRPTVKSNLDPVTSNDSALVSTFIVRRADLVMAASGPPFVTPGAPIPIVLTVRNLGPDVACEVVVSDPIPAGLASPELPGDGSCSITANEIRCSLDELAAGGSHSFDVGFQAPPVAACGGSVVNTATVSATPPDDDPRLLNNSRSVTTAIAIDLSITKTVDRTIAGPNQPLVYTIVVGNPDACEATVRDTFPAALTHALWCREEAGFCTPSISGNLFDRVTGPATYRVQGFVASGFLGTLANTATVEGPAGAVDRIPANNSATSRTEISAADEEIPVLAPTGLAALALLLALTALRRLRRRSL